MEQTKFISFYLDTRRAKKNGLYPVKLRVFTSVPRTQKLFNTKFEYSIKDFDTIQESDSKGKRPSEEIKKAKRELKVLEKTANDIAKDINPFSFEEFERKMFMKSGDADNVFYQYDLAIAIYQKNKQFGTASNYEFSLKSLKEFSKAKNKGKEPEKLSFYKINKDWLEEYENYMIGLGRSLTTVSFYVRTLRTIFNNAIQEKIINSDFYPFGKKRYQVPSVKKVKKALSKSDLKILLESVPANKEQEKALDFWFFSYASNGINIKDICHLKNKDLSADSFSYYREKTKNTKKGDLTPIIIMLNKLSKRIIEKYRTANKSPKAYLFDILNDNQTDLEKHFAVKNFTKFVSQNLKKLAVNNGITGEISTYWARHSWVSKAVQDGASLAFVGEALNHSDTKTTQNYFAGFADEVKQKFSDSIVDFD